MYLWAYCCDEAANHQLPIAVTFWITWIVSGEECSSLMQNLMAIHCSTGSVLLNVTATLYTYSLNGIYCPHWLVQWSGHGTRMCIPVHSSWLPGNIDVTQTILIILTMAGLFQDRSCVYTHTHTHTHTNLTTGVSTVGLRLAKWNNNTPYLPKLVTLKRVLPM